MKILFLTCCLIFSLSALACDPDLHGISVNRLQYADLSPLQGIKLISAGYVEVSEEEMTQIFRNKNKVVKKAFTADCRSSIYQINFLINGKEATALFTYRDLCDRGLAQGVVKDSEGNIIADITGNEILCLVKN